MNENNYIEKGAFVFKDEYCRKVVSEATTAEYLEKKPSTAEASAKE